MGVGVFKKFIIFLFVLLFSSNVITAQSTWGTAAKSAALRGEWNRVIENTKNWLKEEPDNSLAHFLLAEGYHFNNQYLKSYLEYKILMKNRQGQNKVIKWFEDVVKLNPNNPLAYYLLSSAYSCASYGDIDTPSYKQRQQKSIEALKKAVSLDPKLAVAYSGLAQLIATDALEIKKAMESSGSEDSRNKYNDLIKTAIGYAGSAISLEPNSFSTYLAQATVNMIKGDYDLAIQTANSAIGIAPTPEIYMLLGGIYLEKKSYSDAKVAIKKAIEIDSQEAYFHSFLSLVCYSQESYNEAINSANQAIKLDTGRESLIAYYVLGMSYGMMGETGEAKRFFQKVIEVDPHGEFGKMAETTITMLEGL